jgi:hypothetical protein
VLVGIGLISYSAYLWHQPLLAFARYRSVGEPRPELMGGIAIASLGLAFLSWKYVEVPFRQRRRFSRRQIFTLGFGFSAAIAVFGLAGSLSQGFGGRLDAQLRSIDEAAKGNPRQAACHTGGMNYLKPEQACVFGAEDKIVGALIGDSQADSLAYALGLAATQAGVGFKQLTYSGCPPILDVYRADAEARRDPDACTRYNREVFDYLVRRPQYQYVVLSARWTLYIEKKYFDNGEGGVESKGREAFVDAVVSGQPVVHDDVERRRLVKERYRQTIQAYLDSGKTVILVYPIPEPGWDVPATVLKRGMYSSDSRVTDLTTSYAAYLERNRETIAALDAVGEHPRLRRVRPAQRLCSTVVPERCITTLNGVPLYVDTNHLSTEGAHPIADEIIRTMAQ